jgi:hypothetical protein
MSTFQGGFVVNQLLRDLPVLVVRRVGASAKYAHLYVISQLAVSYLSNFDLESGLGPVDAGYNIFMWERVYSPSHRRRFIIRASSWLRRTPEEATDRDLGVRVELSSSLDLLKRF